MANTVATVVNFLVGDRVKINQRGREAWGQSAINPGCEGTVVGVYPSNFYGFTIRTDWDNGSKNTYRQEDLEHVNSFKPNIALMKAILANEKQLREGKYMILQNTKYKDRVLLVAEREGDVFTSTLYGLYDIVGTIVAASNPPSYRLLGFVEDPTYMEIGKLLKKKGVSL